MSTILEMNGDNYRFRNSLEKAEKRPSDNLDDTRMGSSS